MEHVITSLWEPNSVSRLTFVIVSCSSLDSFSLIHSTTEFCVEKLSVIASFTKNWNVEKLKTKIYQLNLIAHYIVIII